MGLGGSRTQRALTGRAPPTPRRASACACRPRRDTAAFAAFCPASKRLLAADPSWAWTEQMVLLASQIGIRRLVVAQAGVVAMDEDARAAAASLEVRRTPLLLDQEGNLRKE